MGESGVLWNFSLPLRMCSDSRYRALSAHYRRVIESVSGDGPVVSVSVGDWVHRVGSWRSAFAGGQVMGAWRWSWDSGRSSKGGPKEDVGPSASDAKGPSRGPQPKDAPARPTRLSIGFPWTSSAVGRLWAGRGDWARLRQNALISDLQPARSEMPASGASAIPPWTTRNGPRGPMNVGTSPWR